jgi:hypothetical protein
MRMRFTRRGGAVGVAVAAALLLSAIPASAAPGDGSAYAANVTVTLAGNPINVGPLAASNTNGPTTATLASINVPGVLSTGIVTSGATLNQETGAVHSEAQIAGLNLGLLGVLNGSVGAISAVCDATQAGITGSTNLANVNIPAVSVSADPAPNTTVNLPLGAGSIVFNEQITNPNDGSLTVNAIHIKLNALVAGGDIILAQAKCGPAAPPVPLASGLGLWLGLGLLVLVAIPASAMVVRKRHAATA